MHDVVLRSYTVTSEALHVVAQSLSARVTKLQDRGSDRGAATTLEIIAWAFIVTAIVAVGYVAVKALVDNWSDDLKNTPMPGK